ncbi:MAG: [FeFe] hydrogenase H-cluster maturation GTPase HydF [Clostridiales bacterium]
MSLNSTPSGERLHIGIFGKRNAGKSSVINAITGQDLAIVSHVKGTTTDPVLKAMELLPLGPVMIIDTPGLDDSGDLGELRINKAYQILNKTDIAILVVDATVGITKSDNEILEKIKSKEIPYIVVMNKMDLLPHVPKDYGDNYIFVSSVDSTNIFQLKELIAKQAVADKHKFPIIKDLLKPDDTVILVIPIDKSAPKGRLILPQQQTIREILDANATALMVKENGLVKALLNLKAKPALVVTDSQIFETVAKTVPKDIPLTSFSILFARHKGDLFTLAAGAKTLDNLKDGDKVLISEGCTHHRQCEDIGTVKLPKWVNDYTGKELIYKYTGGVEFPLDLTPYKIIIHCGGCTLNEREMQYRIECAGDSNVPITNYGIAISYMRGILERSLKVFS